MFGIIKLIINFFLGAIATFGFALSMQVPKKHIIRASMVGGYAWVFYLLFESLQLSAVASSFFAACVVSIFSETFARIFKAPSIVYAIPGIIPLIPGRGLYFTIEHLIAGRYEEAISSGTTTIAIAGAISLGIILITSFARSMSTRNSRGPIFYKNCKQK